MLAHWVRQGWNPEAPFAMTGEAELDKSCFQESTSRRGRACHRRAHNEHEGS